MVTQVEFKQLALTFAQAEELPHFENTSFRIKKKIFATLSAKDNRACLKLSEMQQSLFCSFDSTVIYPVPNKWGKQGWTLINLEKVEKDTLQDALNVAYTEVSTKRVKTQESRRKTWGKDDEPIKVYFVLDTLYLVLFTYDSGLKTNLSFGF